MTQLLTAMTALSSPVKVTDANTFSANIAAIQNLNNRQVLGFDVQCLMNLLHTKGGTDYRTNHDQLRIDATTFMGTFGLNDVPTGSSLLSRMMAVIDWNTAYGVDNTLTTNVGTIVTAMKGMQDTPELTLWQFIQFLNIKLSLLGI